jgi:hypothetical protein
MGMQLAGTKALSSFFAQSVTQCYNLSVHLKIEASRP